MPLKGFICFSQLHLFLKKKVLVEAQELHSKVCLLAKPLTGFILLLSSHRNLIKKTWEWEHALVSIPLWLIGNTTAQKRAGVLRVSACNLAPGRRNQTRAAGCITRGFDLLFQREGKLLFG